MQLYYKSTFVISNLIHHRRLLSVKTSLVHHNQGDLELYTSEKQRERRANKRNPGFLSAVRMIWSATKKEMTAGRLRRQSSGGLVPDGSVVSANGDVDGIDKAAFVSLMVKVHFLIVHPPVRRA